MARNISRNPNQILRRKPNLFPTTRFQELNWGKNCPLTETDSNGDLEENGGDIGDTVVDPEKLKYLKDRFNKPTCECPSGPKGET